MRLTLLNAFDLSTGGERVELSVPSQRLLAFLGLRDAPLLRAHVAGMLWLDSTEEHALGSLRSALWSLGRSSLGATVEVTNRHIGLSPDVVVDLRVATAHAQALLHGPRHADQRAFDAQALSGDLLPDWYDDWLVIARERFRQIRVHALECMCDELTAASRFGQAIEAGLAAVDAEPLRESAHRALIRVHLAEGNCVDALHQFQMYEQLLGEQVGLRPSAQIRTLVRDLLV